MDFLGVSFGDHFSRLGSPCWAGAWREGPADRPRRAQGSGVQREGGAEGSERLLSRGITCFYVCDPHVVPHNPPQTGVSSTEKKTGSCIVTYLLKAPQIQA